MKRRIIGIISLCLLMIVLAFCLASCSVVIGAEAVWEKICNTMDAQESYDANMALDMTFYVDGAKCSAEGDNRILVIAGEETEFFYLNETEMTLKIEGRDNSYKINSLMGYKEGQGYFSNSVGNATYQKIRSAMTPEEFMEYISDETIDVNADFINCETKEYTENEDGTHTLRFSGYSAEQLDFFCDVWGLYDLSEELVISSMTITVNADGEYRVTDIKLEPSFKADEDGNTTSIIMEMKYKDYNTAQRAGARMKTEEYTEVENIKVLSEVQDMVEALNDAEQGELVLTSRSTVKVAGDESVSEEIDNVTYGRDEKGFYYNISAEVNGEKVDISYSEGKQIVKVGNQKTEIKQKDKDAERYIKQLVGSHGYDKSYVRDILETGDGTYRFKLSVTNTSAYSNVHSAMGASLIVDQGLYNILTLTVEEGKIVRVESRVETVGRRYSFNTITHIEITFETVIEYK